MDPVFVVAIAFFPVLIGTVVIWGIIKSVAKVRNRPQVLAAAGSRLGLAGVSDHEAYAKQVLDGTLFPWANAAAAAKGGEVSVVDLSFQTGGSARFSRLETVAVFHLETGLPRMVLAPSSFGLLDDDQTLKALKLGEGDDDPEELSAFGYAYLVFASDEAKVRALLAKPVLEAFNKLDDDGRAPLLEVLPDRVAFCRLRTCVEPEELPAFLAEGRQLVALLRGGK